MSDPDPLVLSGASVRLGGSLAVDGVSLRVRPGTSLAVTGANGAGKSTVLRAALGLVPVDSGEVEVLGLRPTSRADLREIRRRVAYVPQRPVRGRFPLTVREIVESSGHPLTARDRAGQAGVGDLWNRVVATLSGGQLQRCYIARALAQVDAGASLVLADEPTSALDFEGQEEVAALLVDNSPTLVVVTHERHMVDECTERVEMAAGRLRAAR